MLIYYGVIPILDLCWKPAVAAHNSWGDQILYLCWQPEMLIYYGVISAMLIPILYLCWQSLMLNLLIPILYCADNQHSS